MESFYFKEACGKPLCIFDLEPIIAMSFHFITVIVVAFVFEVFISNSFFWRK